MIWFKAMLVDVQVKGQQVVLSSHFSIYPVNAQNLWNDATVIMLLEQYAGVFA